MQWLICLLVLFAAVQKISLYNTQIVYPKIYENLIEIDSLVLQLNAASDFYDNAEIRWVGENGDVLQEKTPPDCDYKTGIVKGLRLFSKVAVSVCDGEINGYIQLEQHVYLIQPASFKGAHVVYEVESRKKRSTDYKWEFFNLTGDVIEIGDEHKQTEVFNETVQLLRKDKKVLLDDWKWRREEIDTELGYFYDVAWEKDPFTVHKNGRQSQRPPYWLKVAMAVDFSVIKFHGRERVEKYVLALMNIVNAIYQDSSLDANIRLVLTRLLFYEHKRQSVVKPGNAKRSLENVNSWNRRLHTSLAPGETPHDIAVWLTRLDIGGPSGYAPIGGACDPKRSCALNRDEGLTSAFIIAHEMAHMIVKRQYFSENVYDFIGFATTVPQKRKQNIFSLEWGLWEWRERLTPTSPTTSKHTLTCFMLQRMGLSHDGDLKAGNTCTDETIEGSVMAPMVSATFHKFSWSNCSREEFMQNAGKWTCLSTPPPRMGHIALNATFQNAFSMDEQCRMEFGEGYSLCRAFEIVEPCSHLWCGHVSSPLVCKTKKGPPLEGTDCGFGKWCIEGYCQDVGNGRASTGPVIHNPQDGGWGEWGVWGPCSRTCGTGVSFRTRKCDNPSPAHGGSDCFGVPEEWKLCNTNVCPPPLGDIRAEQCDRLPTIIDFNNSNRSGMQWLPYESDEHDMKCKLICISQNSRELYVTDENLIDGTPCSYENSTNICIQGVCHTFGCDGKLFSSLKVDSCGTCGGNNTECRKFEVAKQKKLKREVSRVALIPKMSREIKFEANTTMSVLIDPSVAFVLKNRRKKKYIVTIPNSGFHTEIVEGTKFYYKKYRNKHTIWAKGPVLAELLILIYAPKVNIDLGVNVSTRAEYYVHNDTFVAAKRYRWISGGWGPCSASCGGGRRHRTMACWDDQTEKIVRKKHCAFATKPALVSEKCNTFSCNFHWIAGEWEACSATCGSRGTQTRQLYCVPQSVLNEAITNHSLPHEVCRFMVTPSKCPGTRPPDNRPCNRIPCLSYWTYEEWSQCSVSCGRGFIQRHPHCLPLPGESFYTCETAPKVERRRCRGNHTECRKKSCGGDYSRFCSLSLLSKYCTLAGFRRLCCRSCLAVHLTPTSY